MTQPPPDPLDTIRHAISTLERTVNGDPGMNVKPIRGVIDEMWDAVEQIQRERADEKAEARGQKKTLSWIFGTSAATAITVITLLVKTFAGGGTP